jgi:hypothetical protein
MKNFIDRNVGKIIVMVALAVVEITQAVLDTQNKGRKRK